MTNTTQTFLSSAALRGALATAENDPQTRTELFERSNGDVLVVATMPEANTTVDSYLAGQAPNTRTKGVSIMTAEAISSTRNGRKQTLRRVRIATNGEIRFDTVLAASAIHTQIVRWWEGQPAFRETI